MASIGYIRGLRAHDDRDSLRVAELLNVARMTDSLLSPSSSEEEPEVDPASSQHSGSEADEVGDEEREEEGREEEAEEDNQQGSQALDKEPGTGRSLPEDYKIRKSIGRNPETTEEKGRKTLSGKISVTRAIKVLSLMFLFMLQTTIKNWHVWVFLVQTYIVQNCALSLLYF